jgi:branched-chain amino acid transport system permease protein
VYALLALGLALVFGIMRFVNFAYGEFIMVGAYALVVASSGPASAFLLMAIIALVTVVVLSLGVERIAFRPLRGADSSTLLITSFAISYLLQNLALLIFGSKDKGVTFPAWATNSFDVGSVSVRELSVITVVVVTVLLVGLARFSDRTRMGLQMRAAAEDFQMSRLLGVPANHVIATVFLLSGGLAGVAAILLVAETGSVTPLMGVAPVIVAFVAIVVGGLGSLQGAVLGGYLLGILSVALQATLPIGLRGFRDAFLYSIVIVILIFRPAGLLTHSTRGERV